MASKNKDMMARTAEEYAEDIATTAEIVRGWAKQMFEDAVNRRYRKVRDTAQKIGQTMTRFDAELAKAIKFSRPGAKATFKVEDRFYFGKGRKERFERRMTSQELGHLRNWISNYARNTDEAVNAMNKMQRIFEDDAVFWEDKGWSAVARAAGVLSFSRFGQPERFAITRQPGSCLYANNTGTDVSGYHSAIAKAIEKGGKFDSDFSDVFKLTRSPAGSVCLWSLTWA